MTTAEPLTESEQQALDLVDPLQDSNAVLSEATNHSGHIFRCSIDRI